jgi:hypothetical protein
VLAGIDPVGVTATRDADALLSAGVDCVMYAAPAGPRPAEALADFCRILSSGTNIATTSLPGLVYERGSLLERFLDPIRETCEFLPTPRDLHTACGLIPAGTVGATYAKCIGVIDGEEVVSLEHVDRMADDMAPDWPTGRTGATDGIWRVLIDGEPSFDGEFEVGYRRGESASEHGLLATGMRAVNAIPWVCEAAPGIVDALHLPLTSAVGALHPHRDGVPAF